jgi:hypothetical protein
MRVPFLENLTFSLREGLWWFSVNKMESALSVSEYSASLGWLLRPDGGGRHGEAGDGNCNWLQKEIRAWSEEGPHTEVRGVFQGDEAPGIGAAQMPSGRVARRAGSVQTSGLRVTQDPPIFEAMLVRGDGCETG